MESDPVNMTILTPVNEIEKTPPFGSFLQCLFFYYFHRTYFNFEGKKLIIKTLFTKTLLA